MDSLPDAALQPVLAPAPVTAELPDAVRWAEGMPRNVVRLPN